MKPSDITISTKHLYSGYTAPEEIGFRVADAWKDAADHKGLALRAYKGSQGMMNGWHIVAWCVDEADDMYLIRLDLSVHEASAVFHQKAQRLQDETN